MIAVVWRELEGKSVGKIIFGFFAVNVLCEGSKTKHK